MQDVTVLHGHDFLRRPLYARVFRSGGRFAGVRVGCTVFDLAGVEASLVRPPLVLDHGGFATEALNAD